MEDEAVLPMILTMVSFLRKKRRIYFRMRRKEFYVNASDDMNYKVML